MEVEEALSQVTGRGLGLDSLKVVEIMKHWREGDPGLDPAKVEEVLNLYKDHGGTLQHCILRWGVCLNILRRLVARIFGQDPTRVAVIGKGAGESEEGSMTGLG